MDAFFFLCFGGAFLGLLAVWAVVDAGLGGIACRLAGHDDVKRIEGRTLRLECLRCRRTTPGVTLPHSVTTIAEQFRVYSETGARRC